MKIKKALLSCLLMAGVLSASAQDQQPKTEYVPNPYWYVQLQAGAQYTEGEIKFKDLISPTAQVTIGRQFTPVLGLRLGVGAYQSKAGITYLGQTAKWDWKYVAPALDVTLNLSNAFFGYNPNRLFNLSIFAGAGANIGFDNPAADISRDVLNLYPNLKAQKGEPQNIDYLWDGTKVRFFGRAGVAADFRISESVSVGIEVNANTLSDKYNSKKAGNPDFYFNALAGVKINLGPTHTTRTILPPKPQEKIIEKVIERVIEKPVPAPLVAPTAAVEVKKSEPFRRDIFFTISSTSIVKDELAKVKEVADYLKANPKATVEVTGYADKGTGSSRINKTLSQRRAQAVANALTRTYGINASRIKVDSKGDTVQPFAKAIENRVAIAIAE